MLKRIVIATLALLSLNAPAEEGWIQLFNGKDMTGWKPKFTGFDYGVNYNDTFRVEEGLLKVRFDKWDKFDSHFGHLFFERPFTNYILRVEYRFVGDQCPGGPGWAFRNSGVMAHGQDPKTMTKEQDFPVSIEVQILGGTGKPRTTGNMCSPGTHIVMDGKLITTHCVNSTSKTFDGDQWVTLELEVRSTGIVHRINGETVMTYTEPQLDEKDANAKKLLAAGAAKMLTSGSLSLQAESHPCDFRKVEIKELKD